MLSDSNSLFDENPLNLEEIHGKKKQVKSKVIHKTNTVHTPYAPQPTAPKKNFRRGKPTVKPTSTWQVLPSQTFPTVSTETTTGKQLSPKIKSRLPKPSLFSNNEQTTRSQTSLPEEQTTLSLVEEEGEVELIDGLVNGTYVYVNERKKKMINFTADISRSLQEKYPDSVDEKIGDILSKIIKNKTLYNLSYNSEIENIVQSFI